MGTHMNQRDKLLIGLSPFILLAGWGLAYEIRGILHERAIVRAKQEHRLAEIDSIKNFAAYTNAVADWQKTLCNGDTNAHLFSADLENVIVRPDGRGIMIYGELKEILQNKDNSRTAVFTAHGCVDTKLELCLTASPEVVQKLQAARSNAIPYFVMSATITSVSKPGKATPRSDAAGSPDETGEVIIVKGRLFDVLYVGPDGYEFELGHGALPLQ